MTNAKRDPHVIRTELRLAAVGAVNAKLRGELIVTKAALENVKQQQIAAGHQAKFQMLEAELKAATAAELPLATAPSGRPLTTADVRPIRTETACES